MYTSHGASYDWSHHNNGYGGSDSATWTDVSPGHQLAETLINEPDLIFVIFFFKEGEDDAAKKQVTDLRSQLKQKLLGSDVVYTEVDLTDEEKAKTYKEVTKLLKIQDSLVTESPVVAMAYNRSGYWIHGDGVPKETAETIQGFVRAQERQAKSSGSTPVSFGGTLRHSSDKTVSVGGY